MQRNVIENEIKQYFEEEGAKGDLPSQQWDQALFHAMEERRGGWRWMATFATRPLLATTASLVLVAVISGMTLWAVAPWEGNAAGLPNATDTPSPRPPARFFNQTWEASKVLVAPGEPVTITLALKNARSECIESKDFLKAVTLKDVDTQIENKVAIEIINTDGIPGSMEPGEEVKFIAYVSPDTTANLQPGRYNAGMEITFANTADRPELGEVRMELNSDILFVVIPPEGALDSSVQIGEVREAGGISVRLEAIHFTPEKTTIVALAAMPEGSAAPMPAIVPTPTPGTTSRATPTPTAPPLPPSTSVVPDMTAQYRIDGGAWRELRGHGYRQTPEGMHNEWTFGPVSANASIFEFAIMSDTGDREVVRWEWTVPLLAD